MACLLVVPWDI